MREFAELIGVSPGTVSKALNPNPKYRISPAKSIYIKEKAREYGFELLSVPQTVEKRKNLRIGLVSGVSFSFLGAFLWEGVQDYCLSQGVKLLFDCCGQSTQRASDALRQMTAEQVDAIIYWPAGCAENQRVSKRLIARADNISEALPLVYIGEGAAFENVYSFRFQDEQVARETANHHLALGCRDFVILYFNYAWGADRRATETYRNTLLEHGIQEKNIHRIDTFSGSDQESMAAIKNADAIWTEHIFLLYSHLEWIARYTDVKRLHVGGVGFLEFAMTFRHFLTPTLEALGRKSELSEVYASCDIKLCSLRRVGAMAAKKAIALAMNAGDERNGAEAIEWLTPAELEFASRQPGSF